MKKRRRLVKFLTFVSTVVVIFVSLAVPCLAAPVLENGYSSPYSTSYDLVSSIKLRRISDRHEFTFTSTYTVSQNAPLSGYTEDFFSGGQSVWCTWSLVDEWYSLYTFPVDTSVFGEYLDGFSNQLDASQVNYQFKGTWHYNEDAYEPVSQASAIVPHGTFVIIRSQSIANVVGSHVAGYQYDYDIDVGELYNGVAVDGSTFWSSEFPAYVNASPDVRNVAFSYTPIGFGFGDVLTVAPYNVAPELIYSDRENGLSDPIWTVRFSNVQGLDYNGYVGSRSHELIYVEPPNVNVSFTSWLGTAISGFVSFQVFPGFSIGALLTTLISFSCVMWFLKLVAGG